MKPSLNRMWLMVLIVIAGIVTLAPRKAFAGDNVLLSVSTDKETYYASSLGTVPIIISVDVENRTDYDMVITQDVSTPTNATGKVGLLVMNRVDGGQPWAGFTGSNAKVLAIRPNTSVLSMANTWGPYITGNYIKSGLTLIGTSVQAHSKDTVFKVEVYGSNFSQNPPPAGGYEIYVSIAYGSIWNRTTGTNLPAGYYVTGPYTVKKLIRIR